MITKGHPLRSSLIRDLKLRAMGSKVVRKFTRYHKDKRIFTIGQGHAEIYGISHDTTILPNGLINFFIGERVEIVMMTDIRAVV